MEPSLPFGQLHIVVAGYQEKTCWSHWLFDLGLTNAEVRGLLRGQAMRLLALTKSAVLRAWRELCWRAAHMQSARPG